MNREAIIHDLEKTCAYCGISFRGESWPHVEGNSNLGVMKIENFCCEEHRGLFLEILLNIVIYLPKTWPRLLRMLPSRPFRLSFFFTCSKHLSHRDLRFEGLLSFNEPFMCSKKGPLLPLNLTEHF